jgi:phage terminase large subunit-like protein
MGEELDWLQKLEPDERQDFADGLSAQEKAEFAFHWKMLARREQLPPDSDWRIWLICAGRGFGKTRAGAEWVRDIAEWHPHARIALVSASLAEARAVMVEGESGILACCPPERAPIFEPSLRRLSFPNGAVAELYSAAEPESLRGPQFSHAWCDELAKWPLAHNRATRVWDNLQLALRIGQNPQVAVTTTPRMVPLMRRLFDGTESGVTALSRGSTFANSGNLPDRFLDAIEADYGDSQLGRQEISGELLTELDGALWSRAQLERARCFDSPQDLVRVVVAVDPPASAEGDACGIIVAAIDSSGIGHVLADCSVERAHPEQWAQAVAQAALVWQADLVVAEANQGGAMVEAVLRAASSALPIRLVHASRGKIARAEPIAALYEAGRIRHHGAFPQLEDQLCGLMVGGHYAGPGRSPDRADALVWALTELMLGRVAQPAIRQL